MKKFLMIAGGILLVVIIALALASFFIEEPLRKHIEEQMNAKLAGYSINIRDLALHPIGLSVDLSGLTIKQKEHPSPPIVEAKELEASIHWRSILRGKLVADFHLDRPTVRLDMEKLKAEQKDKVPVDKKAWQDALQSAYPFKINEFRISNGEFVYLGGGDFEPVKITNVQFTARNIRNIEVRDSVYPSPVRLEASLPETGKVVVDGKANFLRTPFPGMHAQLDLDVLQLARFAPVASRFNLDMDRGTLSMSGTIEFSPDKKTVKLDHVLLEGARTDYIYTGKARKRVPKEDKPGVAVTIEKLTLRNSEFGLINRAAKPDYRVFIADVNATATDFSSGFSTSTAKLDLHGKFMGSGESDLYGTFRPEEGGPDFDLRVAIRETNMRAMNNLFRAYGKFDVAAGLFSFFTELHVKNNRVRGYMKPIFKDMNVHDERQDKEKKFFREAYEAIVDVLSELLENPQETVATKAPVSGTLKGPDLDTWTAIVNLVQNAFFRSILPGFAENIR